MKLNNGLDSQVQLYGFLPVDGDCVILMRVAMMKNSEMKINEKLPAQLEFQPMVLDQLVKEVDVRLGDISYMV